MTQGNWYGFAATFVAGAILSVLVIGYIAGIAKENVADDCKSMGMFRYKNQAFKCEVKNDQTN